MRPVNKVRGNVLAPSATTLWVRIICSTDVHLPCCCQTNPLAGNAAYLPLEVCGYHFYMVKVVSVREENDGGVRFHVAYRF